MKNKRPFTTESTEDTEKKDSQEEACGEEKSQERVDAVGEWALPYSPHHLLTALFTAGAQRAQRAQRIALRRKKR
jgi:hypothetical protein